MKNYQVTITGQQPLLMRWDNIEWADQMDDWKRDPRNKGVGKPGDDRTPPWRWVGYTYNDGKQIVIPSDNISRCLMEGGTLVPTGKKQETFKQLTQNGMMVAETSWPLLVHGKPIPYREIEAMKNLETFAENKDRAAELGFRLLVKRAKVGTSKHIRVRPMFTSWAATGILTVWEERITKDALNTILESAGRYKGLCDWRPSSKQSPGPYGTFTSELREI